MTETIAVRDPSTERQVVRAAKALVEEPPMLDTAGTKTVTSICRLCSSHCGILATVVDGRLVDVKGDPDNPAFKGYTCPKGRALPDMLNDPNRLLFTQKRQAD